MRREVEFSDGRMRVNSAAGYQYVTATAAHHTALSFGPRGE